MTRDVRAVLLSATLVTALSTGLPAQRPARTAAETALDRYVAAPDPAYSFRTVGELSAPAGVSASLLELTSQHWLTEKEVDRPLWRHWLIVYRPVIVTRDVALLFISGGNNDGKRPAKANGVLHEDQVGHGLQVIERVLNLRSEALGSFDAFDECAGNHLGIALAGELAQDVLGRARTEGVDAREEASAVGAGHPLVDLRQQICELVDSCSQSLEQRPQDGVLALSSFQVQQIVVEVEAVVGGDEPVELTAWGVDEAGA